MSSSCASFFADVCQVSSRVVVVVKSLVYFARNRSWCDDGPSDKLVSIRFKLVSSKKKVQVLLKTNNQGDGRTI
jgi:hypothetical protein